MRALTPVTNGLVVVACAVMVALLAGCPMTLPTPQITATPGSAVCSQIVTLNDDYQTATIYFTLDGSTPTTASTKYIAPFQIMGAGTVKAFAVVSDPNFTPSAIVSRTFSCAPPAAKPTFNPDPSQGPFECQTRVTVSDATPGAAIYFTTDGTTPTTNSTVYSSAIPLTIGATTTIRAMAQGPAGSAPSQEATGAYACQDRRITSLRITFYTGGDDARESSQVTAVIGGETQITCIKPSNNILPPTSFCTDDNAHPVFWGWSKNEITMTLLYPRLPSEFSSLGVTLTSYSRWPETNDNWNIQGIEVYSPDQNVCLLAVGERNSVQTNNPPLYRLTGDTATRYFSLYRPHPGAC